MASDDLTPLAPPAAPSDPLPPPDPAARAKPRYHRLRLSTLLGTIGVLIVASNIGTILSATLVNDHPVALIALSARIRHLLLAVAAGIDPLPYFLVGFARLMVPAAAFYLLGRWYGDAGLRWLEKQAGGLPPTIRWVEKAFVRVKEPIVILMPGSNIVCLLAGASKMTPRMYGALATIGILGRLVVFWFLGKALEEPLGVVLDWIQRYQWWIVGAFILLTFGQSFRKASAQLPPRNGPKGDDRPSDLDR
jgi:membrane protein DedA with SNARE-associated domain